MSASVAGRLGHLADGAGVPAALGCLGLAGAVALRVAVAGPAGARSPSAGLVFAGVLCCLSAALGPRWSRPGPVRPVAGALAAGVLAAVLLCAGPALAGPGLAREVTIDGFLPWASVVTVVAVAEEVLLRGALFDVVRGWRGTTAAMLVTSIAFALLHVPVYGWHVVPLDLAVGFGLGALRLFTGGVSAPATAHVLADLAGWWLR